MKFKMVMTTVVEDEIDAPTLEAAREYVAGLERALSTSREKITITVEPATPAPAPEATT